MSNATLEPNARKRIALDDLAALFARHPELGRLSGAEIVKMVIDHAVFHARLNGSEVFIKHLLTPERHGMVRAMQAEIVLAEQALGMGPFRVARCLLAVPDLGLIALEPAPGRRLDQEIDAAGPVKRLRLLELSGAWLARYCGIREPARRPFAAQRFMAGGLSPMVPADEGDRRRHATLQRFMAAAAAQAEGRPLCVAASHGDYRGRNAHHHNGRIVAFDISGERRLAVARDAACFLLNQQLGMPLPHRDTVCGIARADMEAFLASGLLAGDQRDIFLPLYLARGMRDALPRAQNVFPRIRRLRHAVDNFLASPAVQRVAT